MKSRALVFTQAGHVEVQEQEVQTPKPGEILVQTKYNGICAFELHTFTGEFPVNWFPAVMGHEGVGVVAEIGSGVTEFKPGDNVSTLGFNTYRDFYPVQVSEAALIPPGQHELQHWLGEPTACAVNAIRLLEERRPGPRVTVIGCGFMGLLLVQLGVRRGMHITVRDLNPERVAIAERYGARVAPDDQPQDVTIECSGTPQGLAVAESLLRNGGVLCLFAHHLPERVCNTNMWHMKGLDVLNATPAASRDWKRDFQDAVQQIRDGVFDLSPLITHVFDAGEPQSAFEAITQHRPKDYIKGVFRFS